MKNSIEVAKSPILSPKNYLTQITSQKVAGSPKKNFEVNQFKNGANQWFHKAEQMRESMYSIHQSKNSKRLALPRKIHEKWDSQVLR